MNTAIETADVSLMGDNLRKLPLTVIVIKTLALFLEIKKQTHAYSRVFVFNPLISVRLYDI